MKFIIDTRLIWLLSSQIIFLNFIYPISFRVGDSYKIKNIQTAVVLADNGDTIFVSKGVYKEGNINIEKQICFIGEGFPVIDGEKKFEVFSVRSDNVEINGFNIINSKISSIEDPAAIKVYNSQNVKIVNNKLYNNFFGIYLQFCKNCIIKNNQVISKCEVEFETGNGIHCWKSESLLIIANKLSGNRDGIYFEFVSHSVIWRNISIDNVRYGLHFMFSHDNAYYTNYFKQNGAGVAVMYTNNVKMVNNTFELNWGDAAYGLLLKEISDCFLSGNKFLNNTSAVMMDGTNRIHVEKNQFKSNGWGLKIQANCLDNFIERNNFIGNTFDVSTNGTLTMNTFLMNYWDKYEGYDLNKDAIGDIPYHPLSIFAMIVETDPPAMLLYRSFMVGLLDRSEKMMPSLTPEHFIDNSPLMIPMKL